MLNRFSLGSFALIVLLTLEGASHAQDKAPEAAALAPAPSRSGDFFSRLVTFYHQDWTYTNASGQAPPRRGLAQPLDSPPFPSADWSYGGSPTIGEADGNSYPLMSAIRGATSRIKLYGWLEPSVNGSTSSRSNLPTVDDSNANRVEFDQGVIYLERLPDTVQRDHVDVGFHLTALYGSDYRYTTDKGYLSSQLLVHHHEYGFDPSTEYVDIYLPHIAQGMNIRVGRFVSIAGIETQLTTGDYFFSHSLLYSVDPFTDTGILTTTQLNPQWVLQLGVTASHDVAPWTVDAQPSATACVSYTTKSVANNFYLCANGINDGKYAYNNTQQYDITWYHKFSKTWHSATEIYLMYQRDAPSVSGSIKPEAGTDGATCVAGESRCLAPEWAVVNYLNKELGPHAFLGFRSDFLNDKKGQRTGYNTKYTENTVSYNRWIGTTIQFRPEIRLGHAWDRNAYDNGTRHTQFTAATDIIFHF